ncbi:unnamed protein product [Ixodes pacificus]
MQSPLLTPADVSALFARSKKHTSFFHLNTQSLRNKEDDIAAFLSMLDFTFDIIMITETWYQNDSKVIELPQHNTFLQNLQDKRGGGVMIAIKKSFECSAVPAFSRVDSDWKYYS